MAQFSVHRMMTSSDLHDILANVNGADVDIATSVHQPTTRDVDPQTIKHPVPHVLPAIALLEEARSKKTTQAAILDVRHDFLLRQAQSSELVLPSRDSPLAPRRANEEASPPKGAGEPHVDFSPKAVTFRRPPASPKYSQGLFTPQLWQGLAQEVHDCYPNRPSPSPPARRSRTRSHSDDDCRESNMGKENEIERPRISFGGNAIYADMSPLSTSFSM